MNRYYLVLLTLCLVACSTVQASPPQAVTPAVQRKAPVTATAAAKTAKVAKAAKVVKAVKAPVKSSIARQKLAPVPLDLSLPKAMVEPLQFGQPVPKIVRKPLFLPPLFNQSATQPSAFELTGELITNDAERKRQESTDYLDQLDGAQLNFNFRQ